MRTLIATLLVTLFAGVASAQEPRKDLQVFNDVAGQVNRYSQLTVFWS